MSPHRLSLWGMLAVTWLSAGGAAQASPGCTIGQVTGLSFGSYDTLSFNPATTAGSLSLCCTGMGTSDLVSIDLSPGNSQNALSRAMTQDVTNLSYNLYLDSSLTLIWGDGFDGTARYGPVQPPSESCTSIPIYGYMPARQAVPAGTYSDTLTVTLSF